MSRTGFQEVIAMPAPYARIFRERSGSLRAALLVLLLMVGTALTSPAQTFRTLYNFCSVTNSSGYCSDGENPQATLVQGANGNLYGTTFYGGQGNYGTLFKISTTGKLTTIYNFCSLASCADGTDPQGGLVLATNGNFYGVTNQGGAYGYGTVFKITATGKLTTLHSFNQTDGAYPQAGLIQAANGNFYGTTYVGGTYSAGTAFEITPSGTFTSLFSFCDNISCFTGFNPNGLVQGADGNFYGTNYGGGGAANINYCSPYSGGGTAFQLTSSGTFTELVEEFCQPNGIYPNSALVQAASGNFYGTTATGGSNASSGSVYEMTSTGSSTSLYSFCLVTGCADGSDPQAMILAPDGNFYGTTRSGGANSGQGTVFEITPTGNLTTLHTFPGAGSGGFNPVEALLLDTNGIFYGITWTGGKNGGYGTVFSLNTGLAPFVETIPTSGKVGSKVTILGTNLTGATAVSFNGTAATFKVVGGTEITTTVPKGATSGTLTVTTSTGKTLNSSVAFQVP